MKTKEEIEYSTQVDTQKIARCVARVCQILKHSALLTNNILINYLIKSESRLFKGQNMEITKTISYTTTINIHRKRREYCNSSEMCQHTTDYSSYCFLYFERLKIKNSKYLRCEQCLKDFGV